jgi:hypothetical protein
MCVIFIADSNVRPTEDMVRFGYLKNSAGAGAAWRENGVVKWKKGMILDEVQKLNLELPFPYVLHFRQPSHNTAVGPEACHPFVVNKRADYRTEGRTKDGVLFHNGFWTGWREKLLEVSIKGLLPLPGGPWTDTRGLAWMTSHLDEGFLELVDEKVIWFKHDDIHIFGGPWTRRNNVLCSNLQWEPSTGGTGGGRQHAGFYPGSQMSMVHGKAGKEAGSTSSSSSAVTGGESAREGTGGSSQGDSFRNSRVSTQDGSDQQKTVQASDEGTHGKGMAEQSSERKEEGKETKALTLAGQVTGEVCDDCQTEIAQMHLWISDGTGMKKVNRCWTCWRLHRDTPAIPELAPVSPPGTSATKAKGGLEPPISVAKCEFCNNFTTLHRKVADNRSICPTCWVRNKRPSIYHVANPSSGALLNLDEERARRLADASRGITPNHLGGS